MDIHPPSGPTHSLRDFAIHILIVTIGILIAIGLDGLRETWRDHRAVAEARRNFVAELSLDQHRLTLELANVQQVSDALDDIIATMPVLARTPAALQKRVQAVVPSFYFFSTSAWDSIFPGGTLAHMPTAERNRYDDAYATIRHYQDQILTTMPAWIGAEAFFQSHASLSQDQADEGKRQLIILRMDFHVLAHLGQEFRGSVADALAPH